MKRDERLLLTATGQASTGQIILSKIEVMCFPSIRSRYDQFDFVSTVLRRSLSDPEELITIRTRSSRKRIERASFMPVLLVILMAVVAIEWKTYTLPAIVQCFNYVAHQCGIR
jgi:hypothetical protein